MRILVVTPYYKPSYIYGGPARSIPTLTEEFSRLGHSVVVLTTSANGQVNLDIQVNCPIEVNGVTVYYFERSFWLPKRYFYAANLGLMCQSELDQFDIVYICGTWTYPLLPSAKNARKKGVPYIISPRGSFMDWSMHQSYLKKILYLSLLERKYINRASALHCTSKLELDQIVQWHFKPSSFVIPNGIDIRPNHSLPQRGRLRQSLGIPTDALVSLFVGRLHKMKRLDHTIRTFARVSAEVPNSHLLIVGDDEDGTGMLARAQVLELGLSDRIHFTGHFKGNDLLQAYIDSDLLILLSHRENFGMVALEALAVGTPVLLSSQVGIGTEIAQAGAGAVVNADSLELEKTWKTLLRSTDWRLDMSKAALNLVNNYFSSQVVAQQMLDLFQNIIECQPVPE